MRDDAPMTQSTNGDGKRKSTRSVPAQGFETEDDSARTPIQPPGPAELVASAAGMVGDLAKSGFSLSERLVKDVVSRLPRP